MTRVLPTILLMLCVLVPPVHAGQGPTNDLDSFMVQVLARRKVNQDALKDYVLNDVEQVEAIAPGEATLFRSKREYIWYVRDGMHVRSPIRIDGVPISKADAKEQEDQFIKREDERQKRKAKSPNSASETGSSPSPYGWPFRCRGEAPNAPQSNWSGRSSMAH